MTSTSQTVGAAAQCARPQPADILVGALVERWGDERPTKTFALFDDGSEWTYRQLQRAVRSTAWALSDLGIVHGDRVSVWLPNGRMALRVWFAANAIGAVVVPINTGYKGRLLEHVLRNSRPRVAIVHPDLIDRLTTIDPAVLPETIIVAKPRGRGQHNDLPPRALSAEVLTQGRTDIAPQPTQKILPHHTYGLIYTSGTTGPSKGAVCTYLQLHAWAAWSRELCTDRDCHLIDLPLFHGSGILPVYSMLALGASIAMVGRFSTDTYWQRARQTGVTVANLLGVMANFLLQRPPSPDERAHSLRLVSSVPLIDDIPAFRERFGVDVMTAFNMTEVARPIVSELNPQVSGGYCGRVRPPFEARIVDENDMEVGTNIPGELVVRSDEPWVISPGYHGMPEASASAWRNGWFHTGDEFVCDEEGRYYFVDRLKDAIRRRGENVSSVEVERELLEHPAVGEAAIVGVPAPSGDEEILAVVAPKDGASIVELDLINHLAQRLAYFMVPRYIRVVDSLPKTPTNKTEKYVLRSAGVTEDTWDREMAGLRLRRENLGGVD